MSSFLKNTLTILGLIIVAGLGYYLFVMQQDEVVSLDSDTSVDEARVASARFVRELREIESLDISGEIFSDPRFQSFVDFATPVPPLRVGRTNPFAPVE